MPPRLLNPKIDRDLETVCLKCLEKNPRQRYASAAELADDLKRFLEGESIRARSINVLDRLARTLDRSQFDPGFRGWGTMVILFAAILLATHVAIFWLALPGPPYPRAWMLAARAAQFALMAVVFGAYRGERWLPANAAERQLWSIWAGYLTASFAAGAVGLLLATEERPLDELTLFPTWALLAGLAFFAMGSTYWGRCYAFGAAFFAAALVIPFSLPFGPLVTGVLWAVALTAIGLRLRALGAEQPASVTAGKTPRS